SLCFIGTLDIVTLLYLIGSFSENYAQLRRAFASHYRRKGRGRGQGQGHPGWFLPLTAALRRNLAHFAALFTSDQLLGPLFTVYLAFHLPF
ncbi:hypothetical protein TYRP_023721, partial [Tyrophagus putrescentiae]